MKFFIACEAAKPVRAVVSAELASEETQRNKSQIITPDEAAGGPTKRCDEDHPEPEKVLLTDLFAAPYRRAVRQRGVWRMILSRSHAMAHGLQSMACDMPAAGPQGLNGGGPTEAGAGSSVRFTKNTGAAHARQINQ
ncbi:MAG: hypothetical protein J0I74_07355 [Rhodanobacter sp.]|nr:hypothetical protein [Rhodanobacter sp.]